MAELEMFHRALDGFGRRLDAVPDHAWHGPTPCSEWDVHALVNHVVGEVAWVGALLRGETLEEVGDRFSGDLLGPNPTAVWKDVTAEASAAARAEGALERPVTLSGGQSTGAAYLAEVTVDVTIHSWDLARAAAGDERLDPDLVTFAARALTSAPETVEAARDHGAYGPGLTVIQDADEQTRLLALTGRSNDPTFDAIARFWMAVDSARPDAVAAAVTPDFTFDSTPPPDGQRLDGRAAARDFFDALATSAQRRTFSVEEAVTAGDRAVVRWRHDWVDLAGNPGHVRGVDLFRVRDGLVAEKLSYVKG